MRCIRTLLAASALAGALFAGACGGAAATPDEDPDEVTATWTTGDDAPLEGADETSASEEEAGD
ncbi:MAG: hypothetical protein DRJ42_14520 [Deltaproteobacteria bacterium]|nr:MAG: hypothetical protein DRJ42_14520 [Deltaproteobacteria bacterium]